MSALGCLLLLTIGCERSDPRTVSRSSGPQQSAREHLDRTLQFVTQLDEYDRQQAVIQATYHLNRWMENQEKPADWQPDPAIQTLPRLIRESTLLTSLQDPQYRPEDMELLIESIWMRDLSRWISSQSVPSPLSVQVQKQAAEMDRTMAEQLLVAYRLFDWTIRSVQLDPTLEYPADAVAVGTEERTASRQPPPMRGVAGPGYMYTPGQTLLFGHGDAYNRARVFMLLARQQNIPVVMLAFPGLTTPPRPRPWMTAVLIGEQLFLFDTALGLPIPSEDRPIATLAQVREKPELLSSLSIGDEFPYEIPARDLDRVMALIEAAPAALSMRMELVEESLTGGDRVVLTVQAAELQEQLEALDAIEVAELWTLPVETIWFTTALKQVIKNNEQGAADYYLRYGIFESRNSLVQARYHHFRGEFDNEGDEDGAKTLYLESRVPNRQLNQLETSAELQASMGLQQVEDERETTFQNRLALTRIIMTQTKGNASYWLGLAHFDTGRYDAAAEWLRKRTLEAIPDGPWTHGANYNLARTHEALGEIKEAREIYLRDESFQEHGNVLRARLLRIQLEAE